MDVQKIVERFALIAGMDTEEASNYTYICTDADKEITSKLLPNVDTTVQGERLIVAAAALSFYMYTQYKSANSQAESFSAGDISIKENNNQIINISEKIWLHEKAKILDLIRDDEFVFFHVI